MSGQASGGILGPLVARPTPRLTLVLALVCLAVAAGGCKKRRTYDRSSPDATLTAFFRALNKGHLPADLEELVQGREVLAWKLRCKTSGCKRGTFKILDGSERSDYETTLIADYQVIGNDDGQVMHGEKSPIKLIREADRWYIVQFGRLQPGPDRPISVRDGGAEPGDAGSAIDDGGVPGDAAASDGGEAD